MNKKIVIIGSGFSSLSAACFLAKAGHSVTVIEKNTTPGGRARQFIQDGFVFDMGPSWYWMPDVFERFFAQFGKKVAGYYTLQRLDPSYRIFEKKQHTDIPAGYESLKKLFEKIEIGSSKKLDAFLKEAAYKYETGIKKLVFKPGLSLFEFADASLIAGIFRLDVFNSVKSHVKKFFGHPFLQQLIEFPVLFLGALAENIPALYTLMNYADIKGGTWYPQGGMYKIAEAMYSLANELGVLFHFDEEVKKIVVTDKKAGHIVTKDKAGCIKTYEADVVIGGADYHHIETALLQPQHRTYSDAYWEKRVMAPGCLLYYIGINKKLKNLQHHNLFFDASFEVHGKEIYTTKTWPSDPLFYACVPSVTDETVAPAGCENLFLLIPAAAGLKGDTEMLRKKYFDLIIQRMEKHTGQEIANSIVLYKSFAHSDFEEAYHSFKGNAYGLANTLMQTAILKPKCRSKKLGNLFFTGQLTVPGPGVPPSIISGEVVAGEVIKFLNA